MWARAILLGVLQFTCFCPSHISDQCCFYYFTINRVASRSIIIPYLNDKRSVPYWTEMECTLFSIFQKPRQKKWRLPTLHQTPCYKTPRPQPPLQKHKSVVNWIVSVKIHHQIISKCIHKGGLGQHVTYCELFTRIKPYSLLQTAIGGWYSQSSHKVVWTCVSLYFWWSLTHEAVCKSSPKILPEEVLFLFLAQRKSVYMPHNHNEELQVVWVAWDMFWERFMEKKAKFGSQTAFLLS